jgi:hypothetical protein
MINNCLSGIAKAEHADFTSTIEAVFRESHRPEAAGDR